MVLKVATYNVEHFANLFDDNDNPDPDPSEEIRFRTTKEEQLQGVAKALRTVDPDLISIIEGPQTNVAGTKQTTWALKNFASQFGLRQTEAIIGFPSQGSQEIAVMFDPNVLDVRHDPLGTDLGLDGAPNVDHLVRLVDGKGVTPTPRFDS